MRESRPLWDRARRIAKHAAPPRHEIPTSVGVYIWFRAGRPQYAGRAIGKRGLRKRLGAHLATGPDLSHSTVRATVAELHVGVPRDIGRLRPSVMTAAQIGAVNAWMAGCRVGWIECGSVPEAVALEKALLAEWRPPLNLK